MKAKGRVKAMPNDLPIGTAGQVSSGTRRVVLSPATFQPDEAWVTAQAATFVEQAREQKLRIRFVQHDRDSKFPAAFDRVLERQRIEVVRSPRCAPNCQAFVERFIGSLRSECLNHFLFLGTSHLNSVANCWLKHYLERRPHQGKDNELLTGGTRKRGKRDKTEPQLLSLRDIRCEQSLGGLLKHYSRRAA